MRPSSCRAAEPRVCACSRIAAASSAERFAFRGASGKSAGGHAVDAVTAGLAVEERAAWRAVPAAGRGDAFQNGWSGCLITGMTIVVGFGIRGEAVCGRGRAARGVGAVTNWAVCFSEKGFSEKGFSEKGSTAGPKRRRPAVQGCNRSIVQPVIVTPR